jgi:hypothetical protein
MATVTQFWTPGLGGENGQEPVFQLFGTTLIWTWAHGDDAFYWGFAVRPLQDNVSVSVGSPITAISDNNHNQVTQLTVTVGPGPTHRGPVNEGEGSLLRFTAIKVQTP